MKFKSSFWIQCTLKGRFVRIYFVYDDAQDGFKLILEIVVAYGNEIYVCIYLLVVWFMSKTKVRKTWK